MRHALGVILLFVVGSANAQIAEPQLLASVNSVELAGHGSNQIIFSGSEIIDLYDLYDGVELFYVNESVIPGTFNSIRLYVDSVVFCEPQLIESSTIICSNVQVGGNRVDLVPSEPFTIASADVVSVVVNSTAKEPIKLNESRKKTTLRKIIKVEISSDPVLVPL